MSETLSAVLMLGILFYFWILCRLLKMKVLELKYTLLWMLTGAGLAILAVFPDITYTLSAFIGVKMPVNAMFLLMVAFLFFIVLSITVIVSRQSERIKRMAQKMALLEKRVRDTEKREKNENRDSYISGNK